MYFGYTKGLLSYILLGCDNYDNITNMSFVYRLSKLKQKVINYVTTKVLYSMEVKREVKTLSHNTDEMKTQI